MGHLTIVTKINAPAAVCFDAARSVDAHVESARFSDERLVVPGKLTGYLEPGDLVCFEGRHFGVKQRFCARITQMERPKQFTDEMVTGAFKSMRHIHQFEENAGVTTMTDVLDWTTPLGALGRAADWLFLERHMAWFVRTKQATLKGMIEGMRDEG